MNQSPFRLRRAIAERLHADGVRDESRDMIVPPDVTDGRSTFKVRFTCLAWNDWEFLAAAQFPGAAMQFREMLTEGLACLRSGEWAPRDMVAVGSGGHVFSNHRFCWVLRFGDADYTIIVHGIARPALDPFRRIWRYFDQNKALDLLRSSELYLRRLDLLADQFEARPSQPMVEARVVALTQVFGKLPEPPLRFYEQQRRATYINCWHKAEEETPRIWAEYCGDRGGLALQTTERQLQHQFVRMREGRAEFFYRDVAYVDHNSHDPASHGIPEQAFLKRKAFVHENEIRFAWYAVEAISGTSSDIDRSLAALPDGRRLPFDLEAATERIVLNPLATAFQQQELLDVLAQHHPELRNRICASAIKH